MNMILYNQWMKEEADKEVAKMKEEIWAAYFEELQAAEKDKIDIERQSKGKQQVPSPVASTSKIEEVEDFQ